MAQSDINTSTSKVNSIVSVDSIDQEKTAQSPILKPSCATHGSSIALIDRELQTPRAQESLRALSTALNDLADGKKCTKCTVESLVTLLEGQLKDLKQAKDNGEWSKEDRKALKAETKSVFKPAKKSMKKIFKGN